MFEPTEREVDSVVRRSMEMFERAKVGEVAPVDPRVPQKVLVVLDGSSQDPMSISLADAFRRRFACGLALLDGREGVHDNDLAREAAESLQAQPLDKLEGESYEQILAAVELSECDLVVVPSPFQRELDKIGSDSTGTVIDVLLARAATPLLIVRRPYSLESQPFERVVMLLIGENEAAPAAACWTAGMVSPGGRIGLLLVLEDEVLENVQSLMRSLDPDAEITAENLGQAMQQSHVRLHRALQKAADRRGVGYQLDVWHESDARLAELSAGTQHPLLVLAHERADHGSQGHVHDRIRHSPHPVFVVSMD